MSKKDKVFRELAIMFQSKNWVDKHTHTGEWDSEIKYTKEDVENIIAMVYTSLTNESTFDGTFIDEFLERYIK